MAHCAVFSTHSAEPVSGRQRYHLSEAHGDADDNLSLLQILSHYYPVWEPFESPFPFFKKKEKKLL